jgi:hypothetical protein
MSTPLATDRLGPEAGMCDATKSPSLGHFVGDGEQLGGTSIPSVGQVPARMCLRYVELVRFSLLRRCARSHPLYAQHRKDRGGKDCRESGNQKQA